MMEEGLLVVYTRVDICARTKMKSVGELQGPVTGQAGIPQITEERRRLCMANLTAVSAQTDNCSCPLHFFHLPHLHLLLRTTRTAELESRGVFTSYCYHFVLNQLTLVLMLKEIRKFVGLVGCRVKFRSRFDLFLRRIS